MSLVRLRPLAESDVDAILGWVNDPEIVGNIAAFAGHAFTREQELTYIRKTLASTGDVVWSIEEAASGRYLGQTGLHQLHERSRVARLACIIGDRADMGRGFGSAAIRAVLAHGFERLELHKVWLMVFATNTRGRRTYARLGFVEEGVLREEYFHQGGWHDMVRMSLLAREWTPAAA
jgi:RimJ/RimL family protein N-acetyltransferase